MQTVDYQPMAIYSSQGSQREWQEELGSAVDGLMTHASWHPQANFTGNFLGREFTNQEFMDTFEEGYGQFPGVEDLVWPKPEW
jgi:hypothetical protein